MNDVKISYCILFTAVISLFSCASQKDACSFQFDVPGHPGKQYKRLAYRERVSKRGYYSIQIEKDYTCIYTHHAYWQPRKAKLVAGWFSTFPQYGTWKSSGDTLFLNWNDTTKMTLRCKGNRLVNIDEQEKIKLKLRGSYM